MLVFSSIVEHRVFVYACVFLNRIASFEKLKNNNNKTQLLLNMVDSHNKNKRNMHKIAVKMSYGQQCSPFYLSLVASLLR